MAIASRLIPQGLDRRGMGVLAFGHLTVDSCQGLVPALMPFMVAERGYSFAQAGALMLFSSLGSSLLQPLLGIFADRIRATWLMWSGALVAALGMGSAGWMPTYAQTGAALMVGSVGVAMFHPEAVRYASYVSHASGRRGTGMGLFAVGGTAGWALGPLLLTGAVLAVGLRGTALVAVLPAVAAALLIVNHGYLERFRPDAAAEEHETARARNHWGVFTLAAGAASARTGLQFGLQAFVPLYIWRVLETSEGVGNASASVLMVFGAAGTLIGGQLADRIGFRPVVVRSLAVVVPLVLAITVVAAGGRVRADGDDRVRDGDELLPAGRDRAERPPAPRRLRLGRHPRPVDRRRRGPDGAARRGRRREGPRGGHPGGGGARADRVPAGATRCRGPAIT